MCAAVSPAQDVAASSPQKAPKSKQPQKDTEKADKPDADLDLPRALVKRIVKTKLSALAVNDKKDFQINKDALSAFSESAKVFISFVASTANDICREKKRQTLSADDVFTALQELEFNDFIEPLREHLEAFKQATKEKNKIRHEKAKKRKQSMDQGEGEQQPVEEGAQDMEGIEDAVGEQAKPS